VAGVAARVGRATGSVGRRRRCCTRKRRRRWKEKRKTAGAAAAVVAVDGGCSADCSGEGKWRWVKENGVPVGEVQRLCGDGAGFRGEVRLEWLREREDKWRLLLGEGEEWKMMAPV